MQRPSMGKEMVEARLEALLEEARRDRRTRRALRGVAGRAPAGLRATVGLALMRAGSRLMGEVRVP